MISEIKRKIEENLTPVHLEILNESGMHARGTDTSHLKIIVVSQKFEGQKLLRRHQDLFSLLKEEMANLHALSLQPFTPEEWERTAPTPSPRCFS